MLISPTRAVPINNQMSSTPVASITCCDDDVVELNLTAATVTSGLDATEQRLMRLVEIGFGTIEVTIDATSATNPDVTNMLTGIAGLLAHTEGQLTIRTSTSGRIGEA